MLSAFYLYSICGFFRDALLEQFSKISDVLFGDKQFNLNGKEYLDAVYNNPPYVRIESVLLKAFTGMQKNGSPCINRCAIRADNHIPNLMYMTTFDNQASRDEHWKAFREDPQWKQLSAMPEYQHNVSKNTQYFLRPTEYSDY